MTRLFLSKVLTSVQEQAEPVQRLERSERAKQVDNDRRQGDQEGVESTSSTQDVPSRTSNLRKQVRAQVKEEQAGSEPVWKKDAKGIPYRTDSKVGESLRQKENQGQQKPDHSDRNKEHQEEGIQPKKKHQQELQQKGVQHTGETPVMKKTKMNSPLAEYRQGEKVHTQRAGTNQADTVAEAAPSTGIPRRNARLGTQTEEKQVVQKPKAQDVASPSEMTADAKKIEVPSTRAFGEPKSVSHPVASRPVSPAVSRAAGAMGTQSTHPSQKRKRRQKQNLRNPLPKQRIVTKPSVRRPVPKGKR